MASESLFNIYNYIVVFGGGIIAVILCYIYTITRSRPLLNSIPGIFTSLGLFGTFMSIVFALGDIKEEDFTNIKAQSDKEIPMSKTMSVEEEMDTENGMRAADKTATNYGTDNTIRIIRKLVPAFTSSILGLILALIATVICKIIFALEDNKLDKKIDGRSPEECLFGIMEQTSETAQLLRFQEEDTRLYTEQLKSNIAEQNQILQKFIDGFVEKMGDIFDNMKSSITSQVESIGNDQLTKAGDVLASISAQLGTVTTQLIDAQKDSVKELVDKTNTQLEAMAKNVAMQYDLIQKNASDNVVAMNVLKEQYFKTNENMLQQATDMNKQATNDLRESLQGFIGDIRKTVSDECISLHSAIESNVSTLKTSYEFLRDRLAQITHDYEQAGLAFDNAVTNSHRQNESTEKAIKKANESFALLEETNERISKLFDILNSRQDNVETLISHINEMGSAIATLQKLETQLKRLNI